MMQRFLLIFCFVMCALMPISAQSVDADRLGNAISYFQSEKYVEALPIFQDLDANYNLNPRFRAYLALCYYQTYDFKHSTEIFDEILPQLQTLSPQELAVYIFAVAESHFALQQYEQALPYYKQHIRFCRADERGDAYFKMAFCQLETENYVYAYYFLQQALSYYESYNDTTARQARIHQIGTMLIGAEAQIKRLVNQK